MRMFLRKASIDLDPLPLTMSGVRMGERVLQVGVDEAKMAGAIAARVGLSGHAAIAVPDERTAARARDAAADAGVLIDVHVTALDRLPLPDDTFDVVLLNSLSGLAASLAPEVRAGLCRECWRVLRSGGRLVAIEAAPRTGVAALLRPAARPPDEYVRAGGILAALDAAGFTSVRLLAQREGYAFTEGIRA